jgi:hypothetical protein
MKLSEQSQTTGGIEPRSFGQHLVCERALKGEKELSELVVEKAKL